VAPDIHGPFSRENSIRGVDDINARNTEEVRTLYKDAAAFGISLLTLFKIQGGAPDTKEYVPFSVPSAFLQGDLSEI
jgi:hypothetical protein